MRYELETQHFLWDQLLEPGTIIGDDTAYPLPDGFAPSASMKPLDDAARDLTVRTGSKKENWGRPEEGLPVAPVVSNAGTFATGPGTGTINRNNQPIIPPPLEHLTRPNDMRPVEGMTARSNPLIDKALQEQNERMAAENDKRMAEEANAASAKRAAESPNKPFGVSEEMPGQGPKAATAQAQHNLPGQGPGKVVPKPIGAKPAPPAPPSNEVPRNTSGVVPEGDDGKFKDPEKKDEKK